MWKREKRALGAEFLSNKPMMERRIHDRTPDQSKEESNGAEPLM
jgi:hypothetical protein